MDDNSVDLVTAFEVIKNLHNKDNLLKEVHRILRPGGFFTLSTPNLHLIAKSDELNYIFDFEETHL